MTTGIQLRSTLSRTVLPATGEEQLVYILVELTAQGVPQQLPKLPINLCLVADRSSSMRGDRLNQLKDAARRIVDALSDDDYFSLVTFNDRAEVVIPAQRAGMRAELKRSIGGIEAAGGTEMATGMALALQELQRPMLKRAVNRMLLLTDGRTYGDEGRCVEIARRAQNREIGITAIGIGNEWNEDLLETIAARENSRSHYIVDAKDIGPIFSEEVRRMHSVFAQGVRFRLEGRPGTLVRSLDRVRPFIAPVAIEEEQERCWVAGLGDWPESDSQAFILEMVIPSLDVGEHPLMRLTLNYTMPSISNEQLKGDLVLRARLRPPAESQDEVDAKVKHWLERLVAYRLQAGAWDAVSAGRLDEATRRLQMAGTRLFEAGEVELARTIQEEATRLLRSGAASTEGRKRIKYGTRGLIGAPTES